MDFPVFACVGHNSSEKRIFWLRKTNEIRTLCYNSVVKASMQALYFPMFSKLAVYRMKGFTFSFSVIKMKHIDRPK